MGFLIMENQMDTLPGLIPFSAICLALDVNERRCEALLTEYEIPIVRTGRRRRGVLTDDFDRLIDALRRNAPNRAPIEPQSDLCRSLATAIADAIAA
jgi:hypothetical protein